MPKLRAYCLILSLALSVLGLEHIAQAHDSVGSKAEANAATIGNCPIFPSNNAWNRDVSNDPVDPNSAMYIATLNNQSNKNLNFGFGLWAPYGIPYNVV